MEPAPITIADRPSMPRAAVAFLRTRLRNARCYLEYGAGGSTVLAARLGVGRIYSVESDSGFLAAVADKVAGLGRADALRRVHADIGPTQRWGRPVDRSRVEDWPGYSAHVWNVIAAAGDAPETILVDGRFRVACVLLSLLHMPDHALVLVDDYFDREDQYGVVTRYAPVAERHDRMAVFRKPADCDWDALRETWREYARVPA